MYLISVLVHTFYLLASRQKEWDNKDVCDSDGSGYGTFHQAQTRIRRNANVHRYNYLILYL